MSLNYNWPPMPWTANVVQSQDTYLNATTPLISGGGGGGDGPNLEVSTITVNPTGNINVPVIQNISTLNGVSINYILSTLAGLSPGGFTPPSAAPTVPVVSGTATATSITVTFDVAGITGNPTPVYVVVWGTTSTPTNVVGATLVSGTTYTATITGLTELTQYYIESRASNFVGSIDSAALVITTPDSPGFPPSGPPTVPTQSGAVTDTSITVVFNATNIVGTPPLTYSARYSPTTNPNISIPATFVSGDTFTATATGLQPDTPYYFTSVVSNSAGEKVSAVSALIRTAQGGGDPSGPPTVPIVVGIPTSTTISVSFNVAGITGPPPLTYSVLYGTTTTPTTSAPASPDLNSIYVANLTGLTEGTTYYFKSVVTNNNGTQISAVSAGIATPAAGPTPPTAAPSVPAVVGTPTVDSITVSFDTAGIGGSPVPTYSILYGTTAGPTTPGTATLSSGTVYQAVISGLTSGTTYYVKSVATNTGGQQISTVSKPIATIGPPPAPPVPMIKSITGTTATLELSFEENTPGQVFTIYYGQSSSSLPDVFPTTPDPNIPNSFYAVITGLTPLSTYYFQSQSTNSSGSTRSPVSAAYFTKAATGVPPTGTVSDMQPGNITSTTIASNINAIVTGDAPFNVGVIYGTTGLDLTQAAVSSIPPNLYSATLSGLTPNTVYLTQTFVSNSAGTVFGLVISISTSA